MKKLPVTMLGIAAIIGFLSISVEVRPIIRELISDVVGTAADVATAPLRPYWWDNYWGPTYWDDYHYYPYLVETTVELSGDSWTVTNKTNETIIVGTYDGAIRGRIRPGETVKIPTQGDNRIVIGHQKGKAKVFTAQPGQLNVTEKNAQEVQINP